MRIILILTVSGSIVLLPALVFQPVIRRYSLFGWRDFLIKGSLFLYLVPLIILKVSGTAFMDAVYGKGPDGKGGGDIQISGGRISSLRTDRRIAFSHIFTVYLIVTVMIFLLAMLLSIREIQKYIKLKKAITSAECLSGFDKNAGPVKEMMRQVSLKREIEIYTERNETGAFTIGTVHPIIVIPEQLAREEQKVVLLHELCHIKRKDALVKLLITVTMCIHWFNPLVYVLPELFNRTCELCCDEMVLKHLTNREKTMYAREILTQAAGKTDIRNKAFVAFSRGKSLTRERIEYIMKEKKYSKIKKAITALTTVMILFMAVLPAYAYEVPPAMRIDGDTAVLDGQINGFTTDSKVLYSAENSVPSVAEYVKYDHQFIDEEGNVFNADINRRSKCEHPTRTSGYYQHHKKNSDGSCNTETYAAERCTECGTVIIGEYIGSTYYVHCDHFN